MKKLLSVILSLSILLTPIAIGAADLTFGWKLHDQIEFVSNYVIEYKGTTTNAVFSPLVTVAYTNVAVVKNAKDGSYRVVAKNIAGNSPPSDVVIVPTNIPTQTLEFQLK